MSRAYGQHEHAVQFYRDDTALVELLARFVRLGLSSGKPLVLIATASHREALLRLMADEPISAAAFSKPGAVCMLDADDVLSTFMTGGMSGMPDEARFSESVGGVIARAQGMGPGPVQAFGEMVDLLWNGGNPAAAVRLEELWNALATSYRFTLLCAYRLDNFLGDSQPFDIGHVCHLHSHVLPA